jgi:hypothetical protein
LNSSANGREQIEGVREEGAEENIWTEEGGSGGRLEKTAYNEELHNLYASPNIIRVINQE